MAGYQAALSQAQRSGRSGRIVPSGSGRNISYRFVPSGPAPQRRFTAPAAAPAAPTAPTGLTPEARGAFGEAIEQYRPGGGFGAGVEAALGRGRTKAVASGMQSLVSSGLAGTTMAAGLGKKYEEEVGAPARAGVESERARMIANLKLALAQAEQGAFEAGAGRGLGYAQLGAQTGLGYAQLGVSERASAGQLGLGYAQVGASRRTAREQLGLGYAELANRPTYRRQAVPANAPSLF